MKLALVALAACSSGSSGHPNQTSALTVTWPPIVDSHVHLALEPVADQLAAHGVEAAIDLAGPERTLGDTLPIEILRAGPMLTHPNGYPLDAWGSDGYGIGCADAPCVKATVDRLIGEGARIIKIAGDDDGLAPALVPIVVEAAHAHHVVVAIHALSNASALAAGQAGVDVLAHTPVEPLAPATIAAWGGPMNQRSGRAVITTLAAFGGSDEAIANLRALRAAGLTVLYGTDLGNRHDAGPSRDEVELMKRAGMDDAAITDAMTTVPIAFWHLSPTKHLILTGDPRRDVSVLFTARVR